MYKISTLAYKNSSKYKAWCLSKLFYRFIVSLSFYLRFGMKKGKIQINSELNQPRVQGWNSFLLIRYLTQVFFALPELPFT